MTKRVVVEPIIDYDGILTETERKKILKRIESAFCWLGASIPEDIELDGVKFKLRSEIQHLIMKNELTRSEKEHIKKLIASFEDREKFLRALVKTEAISDIEALEISKKICGILRGVHDLRELVENAQKGKAYDAKNDLMRDVEDEKRWLKYIKKLE